jgi:hypothetical protein
VLEDLAAPELGAAVGHCFNRTKLAP